MCAHHTRQACVGGRSHASLCHIYSYTPACQQRAATRDSLQHISVFNSGVRVRGEGLRQPVSQRPCCLAVIASSNNNDIVPAGHWMGVGPPFKLICVSHHPLSGLHFLLYISCHVIFVSLSLAHIGPGGLQHSSAAGVAAVVVRCCTSLWRSYSAWQRSHVRAVSRASLLARCMLVIAGAACSMRQVLIAFFPPLSPTPPSCTWVNRLSDCFQFSLWGCVLGLLGSSAEAHLWVGVKVIAAPGCHTCMHACQSHCTGRSCDRQAAGECSV